MDITAYGHPNVLATHRTTIEVTTEDWLTRKGDCIIGVRASHALSDLKDELCSLRGSHLALEIRADDIVERVTGFVHPSLQFTDNKAIIMRKSSFLCPRTLMIHASKAAIDLRRDLINKMKDPHEEMRITLSRRP
ncbi:MAG: DUF371 domain-containing protein [Theionarchaea archaeon]|nr:DUF371 domain-containing protein [Theionarchaea archaeon]MBU7001017.1 DUF371 domain-containing protein [Theionarchaea archaeon]MBU7034451.1 DUF371 domain-containing protein [Theionarchaea archaeon]MBU7039800.1 DUF371 domain-containing protein [Theionarchaea archaeon]